MRVSKIKCGAVYRGDGGLRHVVGIGHLLWKKDIRTYVSYELVLRRSLLETEPVHQYCLLGTFAKWAKEEVAQ